jgi:hypothetical protein
MSDTVSPPAAGQRAIRLLASEVVAGLARDVAPPGHRAMQAFL